MSNAVTLKENRQIYESLSKGSHLDFVRSCSIALPKIVAASDLVAAASAIVEAIAEGTVTPSEAAALSAAVSGVAKAVETYELADRLAKLEEQMAAKGSTP